MKNWKLSALLNTPLRLILALGLLILVVELFIMTVINDAFISLNLPDVYWPFFDAILLTIIISPALYSLVFQKLQSEEHFRQINASVQDAIVIVNEQGSIVEWNPAAQRIFQYSQEEAIGQQMHQLLVPSRFHADAARGFVHFQEAGQSPLAGTAREVVAVRKDGSELSIELSLSAFKVRGRRHSVAVIRDITERKQAENTLRDSQQLLDSIVEHIPVMVFVKRASDLCFELFNRAGEKLLGYSRNDLLGKGNHDLWPKDQGDWLTAADRKVLASHEVTEILEEPIKTASGETRYLHTWKAALHDANGEPLHLLGISIDITEQKLAEAKLAEQVEELRRWHDATIGRETRTLELKREVNELLGKAGQPPRYPSAEADDKEYPDV